MSKFYRVEEDKLLLGVCSGLGAKNSSVLGWRIAFVISTVIFYFPVLIYVLLGICLPLVKKKNDLPQDLPQIEGTKENIVGNLVKDQIKSFGGDLNKIEVELEKINKMIEKNLITEEEANKLRKKILDA